MLNTPSTDLTIFSNVLTAGPWVQGEQRNGKRTNSLNHCSSTQGAAKVCRRAEQRRHIDQGKGQCFGFCCIPPGNIFGGRVIVGTSTEFIHQLAIVNAYILFANFVAAFVAGFALGLLPGLVCHIPQIHVDNAGPHPSLWATPAVSTAIMFNSPAAHKCGPACQTVVGRFDRVGTFQTVSWPTRFVRTCITCQSTQHTQCPKPCPVTQQACNKLAQPLYENEGSGICFCESG